MGSDALQEPGVYVWQLADHARKLQCEAREALAHGHYTRASALLGHAELLAEDVHALVAEMERHEIGGLASLTAFDVRAAAEPASTFAEASAPMQSRRIRIAFAATVALGLALLE
jgi:hypothetical protein